MRLVWFQQILREYPRRCRGLIDVLKLLASLVGGRRGQGKGCLSKFLLRGAHYFLDVTDRFLLLLMSFLEAHQDLSLSQLQLTGLSLPAFNVSRLIKDLLLFFAEGFIKFLLLLHLDAFSALLGLHLYLHPSLLICLSVGFLDHQLPAGEDLALLLNHRCLFPAFEHYLRESLVHDLAMLILTVLKHARSVIIRSKRPIR